MLMMLMMLLFMAACFPHWAGTLWLMLMMLMMLACGHLLSPTGRDPLADAHNAHDAGLWAPALMGRDSPADAHDAHDAGLWPPASIHWDTHDVRFWRQILPAAGTFLLMLLMPPAFRLGAVPV